MSRCASSYSSADEPQRYTYDVERAGVWLSIEVLLPPVLDAIAAAESERPPSAINVPSDESDRLQSGFQAEQSGDLTAARIRYQEALAGFEAVDDRAGMANAHRALGGLAQSMKNPEEALEHYEQCLALREAIDDYPGTAEALLPARSVVRGVGQLPTGVRLPAAGFDAPGAARRSGGCQDDAGRDRQPRQVPIPGLTAGSPRSLVVSAAFGCVHRKADEEGIPGRISTEENAARCVPGRRKTRAIGATGYYRLASAPEAVALRATRSPTSTKIIPAGRYFRARSSASRPVPVKMITGR